MDSFIQKQIAELLEINPNTIQAWRRDGLITPSVANPKGKGTTGVYSSSDLVQIRIVSILSRHSFNRKTIEHLCHFLNAKHLPSRPLALRAKRRLDPHLVDAEPLYLTVSMTDFHWQMGPEIKVKGTVSLVINISEIKEEILRKIGGNASLDLNISQIKGELRKKIKE